MPTSDARRHGVWRMILLVIPLALLALVAAMPPGTAEDQPAKPPPPAYAGADTCVACHSDLPAVLDKDWHGRRLMHDPGSRQCEECHGPSAHHTEDPAANHTFTNAKYGRAADSGLACLNCHQQRYRPADWRASEHARANVACWDCHSQGKPHEQVQRQPDKAVCYGCHTEQKPAFEMTSHHPVREGRVGCSDCHDPHKPKLSVPTETNKLCVSCHARQRGPFIFEHGAISGQIGDGCLECHQAHGSPNARLLKYPGRGLCLQCHADHVLHFAPALCWDCHKSHHGSNTQPLFLGP